MREMVHHTERIPTKGTRKKSASCKSAALGLIQELLVINEIDLF